MSDKSIWDTIGGYIDDVGKIAKPALQRYQEFRSVFEPDPPEPTAQSEKPAITAAVQAKNNNSDMILLAVGAVVLLVILKVV